MNTQTPHPSPPRGSSPGTSPGASVESLPTTVDLPLVVVAALLMVFGLAAIYSAGRPDAAIYIPKLRTVPVVGGLLAASPGLYLVFKQLVGIFLGLLGGMAILAAPRRRLISAGTWVFVGALVLMFLVQSPLGHSVNGARRWINLGLMNLQPSELAKVGLVWALATHLGRNEGRMADLWITAPVAGGVVALSAAVILQSDLGTLVLVWSLTLVALFVSGFAFRYLATLLSLGALGVAIMISVEPYRRERLMAFLDPWKDPQGAGYQIIKGWQSIAAGGLFGRGGGEGLGQTTLPEAHTDMIIAIVAEEWGAVGWLAVVVLHLLLLERGMSIAARGKTLFDTLLAGGLALLLGAQATINMGVVGGVLPNKGLVLPFMSYGASAVMAHTFALALIIRIGQENHRAEAIKATGRVTSPGA